jgi:Protein of unknown function (DUF1549)/Protein of unknown function (DUF1553)
MHQPPTGGGGPLVKRHDDPFAELRAILDALFEEQLTPGQAARLEELILHDAAARTFYLESIDLHGNLYWDAAQGSPEDEPVPVEAEHSEPASSRPFWNRLDPLTDFQRALASRPRRESARSVYYGAAVVCALAAIVATIAIWSEPRAPQGRQQPVTATSKTVRADRNAATSRQAPQASVVTRDIRQTLADRAVSVSEPAVSGRPPVDDASSNWHSSSKPNAKAGGPTSNGRAAASITSSIPVKPDVPSKSVTDEEDSLLKDEAPIASVPAFIDSRIKRSWHQAGIEPSPVAKDGEWLRRAYLDIVGQIPSEEAVDAFLSDHRENKRDAVVNRLLDDPRYPRNWATIWANLLVGRHPQARGVSHAALEKFLRDHFAASTPWNEIVYELVSAEGNSEQNPATNFLLAHLNNDALPATALTARLFLGIQVQCNQCHDHPFRNDKQSRFWELKSFFQQTEIVSHPAGGASPQMAEFASLPELVDRSVGGPTYYETRRGEMRAVFPVYAGHKIDPGPSVNRRRELARLIARGDDPQLALAMVNRTWQHFLGYGFTQPVDDLGPHNPATYPEALNRLSEEFVASGYDLKQLIRWICATDAYRRSSAVRTGNKSDDPTRGTSPLFSHVYLRPMTAEQLYDSLLAATRAKDSLRTDWNDVGRRREDWVRQFIINYGTDENDETTMLAGSVLQALTMMNDRIVHAALAVEPGTLLYDVANDASDDAVKIRRLCRSALCRDPSAAELRVANQRLEEARDAASSEKARWRAEAAALQDIFWAYLNSNEFALVH